jgi:UDP-N-acetylglucosamine 2-epimerase (non-hydrolysing)
MNSAQIAFVLGTRPEIIKLAPVIHECERRGFDTHVIHTGQHYSESLDEVFFEQLELDSPEVNLSVGSGTHGEQTGKMLIGIEQELLATDPDVLFVQGDTNSTFAGAISGAKLDLDLAHVEAGLRSFDREMPEEVNRVAVDHLADYLFAPTDETAQLLRREGVSSDAIEVTGNTVVDSLRACQSRAASTSTVLRDLRLSEDEFYLLTAHREENVDDPERFENLIEGVGEFATATGKDVVYPIHPRAKERLKEFELAVPEPIQVIDPLGFIDFLRLESTASLVFTDSGGVQEEACVLGTPCVTLRYGTERPETAFVGANCIAGLQPDDIVEAARQMHGKSGHWEVPFGDGDAAERIVNVIDSKLKRSHPT